MPPAAPRFVLAGKPMTKWVRVSDSKVSAGDHIWYSVCDSGHVAPVNADTWGLGRFLMFAALANASMDSGGFRGMDSHNAPKRRSH